MAKKMQRLDESPDFRPFKFRIQAFTLAFLDEVGASYSTRIAQKKLTYLIQLAAQGYPEEKIPMKKVCLSTSDSWDGFLITYRSDPRYATTFGGNNTSSVSTRMGKRLNQKGITFGTSKQKRQATENGNSALSIVNWLDLLPPLHIVG